MLECFLTIKPSVFADSSHENFAKTIKEKDYTFQELENDSNEKAFLEIMGTHNYLDILD